MDWTDKPLLASELISALSNPTRGIANFVSGKYATAMSKNVQIDMVQSQKFLITDNLLDHAIRASYVKPKYLLDGLHNTRPPFNNMWVEWNEKERVKKNRKELVKLCKEKGATKEVEPLIDDGIPDRIGYHIKKLTNEREDLRNYAYREGETILYTCFFQMEDKRFYCPEMGFNMNYECDYDYASFVNTWNKQNNFSPVNMTEEVFYHNCNSNGAIMLGATYSEMYKGDPYIDRIFRNLIPVQTCSTHWVRSAQDFLKPVQEKESLRHAADLSRLGGDPRFLISLLNMLNYDLVSTETVIPPKKISHIYLSRSVPRNEYKVVQINLPKPRGKRVYNKMFTGQGSPKREHWRRGHWRRVHDRKGNLIKRIWIGEQKVGNAELGKIVHDYELVQKSQ
tara:strand:+ start:3602 stop:4786 length:1185 start_codon:yes stop_codon:yes gene_type:complete